MKATKAIAALCATTMALSTMALPVQAKVYIWGKEFPDGVQIVDKDGNDVTDQYKVKPEDRVKNRDRGFTPTSKPKYITVEPRAKTKAEIAKAKKEYKNFGKDLVSTKVIDNYDDFVKGYSYALKMCAKSFSFDVPDDYKLQYARTGYASEDFIIMLRNYDWNTYSGHSTCSGVTGTNRYFNDKKELTEKTVVAYNCGNVMTYFTYAYRTGDTSVINEIYSDFYRQLAVGVDACTESASDVETVAQNVSDWIADNTTYDKTGQNHFDSTWITLEDFGEREKNFKNAGKLKELKAFTARISHKQYAENGDFLGVCEVYANIFAIMMNMAGYDAWVVTGEAEGGLTSGGHAWNAIKVGDEYKYYDVTWYDNWLDAGWDREAKQWLNMTYEKMREITNYGTRRTHTPLTADIDQFNSDNWRKEKKKREMTRKELEATFI